MYQKGKSKKVISNQEELKKLVLSTMGDMAEILQKTLGPGGRCVLIERDGMPPLITKDGVTVAKHLGVADAAANLIVDAAKEICLNTAKEAGDGTTTAIILADAIIKEGQAFLFTRPKYNPQRVVNELHDCLNSAVIPMLKQLAMPVESEEQLRYVATISANGDKEIAEMVVKAVISAGDDGTVLINESQGGKIYTETSEGYIVTTGLKDLGQIGPVFINDKSNQCVKMDKGHVILYDGSLNDLKVPALIQDAVSDAGGFSDGSPILVFAHSFADSVLDKFAKQTKNGITVVPVKTPRSGLPNGASMFLDDMSAYTGATVYNPGNVEDLDEDGLGSFESANINMYETFLTANSNTKDIETRVVELKSIMDAAFSELDKSFIRASIAKLTSGVSTVYVGGGSDLEIREKKARVEDAVEAVRSAIAEGIVTGGCTTHLLLSLLIDSHKDYKEGWGILSRALQHSFKILLSNCGENHEEIFPELNPHIQECARQMQLPTLVFDANTHTISNPFAVGIIEPAKVVRSSISSALSVAALLTTIGGIVVVPRDTGLETQMELAGQAFKSMMEAQGDE